MLVFGYMNTIKVNKLVIRFHEIIPQEFPSLREPKLIYEGKKLWTTKKRGDVTM